MEPKRIYSYQRNTEMLYGIDLTTEKDLKAKLNYRFKAECSWCEVHGRALVITGGSGSNEVALLDLMRDFAATLCCQMLTARQTHSSAYYRNHIYVIGGFFAPYALKECERYSCVEDRWEALPPLPASSFAMGVIIVKSEMYSLGAFTSQYNELIQVLSLITHTWRIHQVSLPKAYCNIACFKVANPDEFYFVVSRRLYLFSMNEELVFVKAIPDYILSYYGPSYYSKGKIYASNSKGPVLILDIESLQ